MLASTPAELPFLFIAGPVRVSKAPVKAWVKQLAANLFCDPILTRLHKLRSTTSVVAFAEVGLCMPPVWLCCAPEVRSTLCSSMIIRSGHLNITRGLSAFIVHCRYKASKVHMQSRQHCGTASRCTCKQSEAPETRKSDQISAPRQQVLLSCCIVSAALLTGAVAVRAAAPVTSRLLHQDSIAVSPLLQGQPHSQTPVHSQCERHVSTDAGVWILQSH